MGWFIITDGQGERWAFNNDGLYLLMRTVVRANLIRARSRIVSTDHGFLMPTTYCLETTWAGFRPALEQETNRYWAEAEMHLRTAARSMKNNLVALIAQARSDMAWMQSQRVSANRRSASSIDSVVNGWETALTATRFVRDASATILVVTGGIVSGGTGLAAFGALGGTGVSAGTAMSTLAVGSVMRGGFTYQDTGNVGSAVVNAAGTFTVGAIGLGAAGLSMSTAETATILVIQSAGQGVTTGTQAIVEGRNTRDAAVAAAVSAGFGFAGGVIGNQVTNMSFISQVAISGIADMTGNAAAGAAIAPAENPLPAPAAAGAMDFAGLPQSASGDEAYVARNCLFKIR